MTDTGNPAFEVAYAGMAAHEGGYTDDPADPGNWTGGRLGAGELKGTNGGISAASYPYLDIKNLTGDERKQLFFRDWWQKYAFGQIASASVAAKLFDAAVNIGMSNAVLCLQRALRAYGKPMTEDGQMGPITLAALNSIIPYNLLPALRSELAGHYRLIVAGNPTRVKFLSGWLARAYS